MSDPMTCIHRDKGLCPKCQAEFDEDESAWLEFGYHSEGIERWRQLQQEIAEEELSRPIEAPAPEYEIPF